MSPHSLGATEHDLLATMWEALSYPGHPLGSLKGGKEACMDLLTAQQLPAMSQGPEVWQLV